MNSNNSAKMNNSGDTQTTDLEAQVLQLTTPLAKV